ncbi:hypothetical protein CPB84DRAFT_1854704 [Gymnopilus junonius]|uniref:Fungal-type protein kinase domain-containing protein n=1 Tax=Gymnopilus junonius TaxID=109634 RepID=A0A9P5N8G5_GYMJU|nr:hypothetical protein CPB84DRAFT_1854704 [Gymnopilus junonius]
MPTIGDPITSFHSKTEFISTCLDIVNALEFLNTKAKVIHVWKHGPDDSPSKFCSLAFTNTNTPPVVSSPNDQNNSTSESESASNKAVDVQISAPASTVGIMVGPEGTLEPIKATGLLIDCDFMCYSHENTHQTSGTLPFMAIESLVTATGKSFRHHARHDLESLLNLMLTLCVYMTRPSGQLHVPVKGDQLIKFNKWFNISDRLDLTIAKSSTLNAFDLLIKPHLPIYWQDFAPFLSRLINITWSDKPILMNPNCATHQAYHDILKEAVAMYSTEEKSKLALYAILSKQKH